MKNLSVRRSSLVTLLRLTVIRFRKRDGWKIWLLPKQNDLLGTVNNNSRIKQIMETSIIQNPHEILKKECNLLQR
ncbi:hypothetical protein RclHR1_00180047 [Rhizophagus clarus]|uniref:Uncharacterized protein n=1 Tax=Rhizophagus clarus TaxID=94130 RepID=A0A2Z6QYQ0_9GLOM|nr:hypothetical protein RclHR1_00180047 [Rhizophagus clarus]